AAFGGVLTVLLLYAVGRRLFDVSTGLVAAGMLAVNPWHVQMSRLGHEAALVPLLVTASLAAMLYAGLPFDDHRGRPRAGAAAMAGALVGISCYGYFPLRLFLPPFITGGVLLTWRAWRERLRTRRGAAAIAAFVLAGALTFGPLVWKHLTDPATHK